MAVMNASDEEPKLRVVVPLQRRMKETLLGTIKLKKPAPKHSEPGNWQEGRIIDVEEKKSKGTVPPSTNDGGSPGPVVNQLDDTARATFATGRPLEDALELQVCKHCKKSVLKTAMKAHLIPCLRAKKEKAQRKKEAKEQRERERKGLANGSADKEADEDGDEQEEEEGAEKMKRAGKKVELEKGKKRKAEGDAEKGPKQKKKKEEPKPKLPKPKGPVDVERQCGVMKDGVPCARSLTCKSHSMGAKRAVPGRSLPYDMLLSQYQKKNQAKQQKAALSANAPLEDEDACPGPIDSDEELAAIQHGLSHWNPQPVVPNPVHMPIKMKYMNARLYEQLYQATNGFTVNICEVRGYGAQKLQPGHPGLEGETVDDASSSSGEENENVDVEMAPAIGDNGDADGEVEGPLNNYAPMKVGHNGVNGMGIGVGTAQNTVPRTSTLDLQIPPQRRTSGGGSCGGGAVGAGAMIRH